MLDLERLSVSAQKRVSFDLVAVARDAVADLTPLAIPKGYDLSLTDPGAAVTASGDVQAATRALTNLIGNAIAHSGGTGAIIVCVGADRTITVADEGPGIAQELAPRLFEPFSRGHSDTDGSGLGLHLTREIMSAHGVDVCLIPTGRGAMSRLRFPQPDQQD
jgi:signal transduction histidine kinase